MRLGYGPGDMVVRVDDGLGTDLPDTPTRPVMVGAVNDFTPSSVCAISDCCGLHLRVRFVDWPEPKNPPGWFGCRWLACRFRKVQTTDDRIEADLSVDLTEPVR